MTPDKPDRKRSRFIAEDEDIEIRGNRKPDQHQIEEADQVFKKILKGKKEKK
jgi:hypothetical protein